jgi:hypothetical protein
VNLPARVKVSASATRRAVARRSAQVKSAVVSVRTPGVLVTGVGEQGLVDRIGQEAHESVGVAELGGELRRREPPVLWAQADGRLAPGERERRLRKVP